MKKTFLAILASTLLALAANATSVTYTGTRSVGTGSAILSVTTDGTVGVLGSGNILDWAITVSDGGTTNLFGPLSGNTSGLLLNGTALSATATDLSFDFDAAGSSYALFQNNTIPGGPFYCLQASSCFDTVGAGEGLTSTGFPASQITRDSGNVVIASVAISQTPEPATWSMMALGLGALVSRARRKPATK